MSYDSAKPPVEYNVVLLLQPGQPPRRHSVKFIRLDSVESARAKLAAGKAAWVRAEDVGAVTSEGGHCVGE